MIVRALIASSDASARHQLRELLRAYPWLDCRCECEDGPAALAAMDAERPDLLFADVDLPEIGGLDLIALSAHGAEVILLSGDGAHAEAAFEADALDYLATPVRPTRLAKSMTRVRRRFRTASPAPTPRLFLRLKKELIQVGSDEVSRIEACGDHVNVHVRGDRHLIHLSLKEMQRHVDPEKFLQIHRSHIINLDHVATLRPYGRAVETVVVGIVCGRRGAAEVIHHDSAPRVRGVALVRSDAGGVGIMLTRPAWRDFRVGRKQARRLQKPTERSRAALPEICKWAEERREWAGRWPGGDPPGQPGGYVSAYLKGC